jgi:hypothetical protein
MISADRLISRSITRSAMATRIAVLLSKWRYTPDPTMPASAPISAMEIASKPRRAPSAAAATRIRSFRPGSRRRAGRPEAPRAPLRGDVACAVIWSVSHPGAKVASEW